MKINCYASSFADPEDVRRFRACKAQGHSDEHCFETGDNGIGFWNDDVSEGTGPACALPPEHIDSFHLKHNSPITIYYKGKSVVALLRDHMPHVRHLANAARIDLNPDTCAALGLTPPVMAYVSYEF